MAQSFYTSGTGAQQTLTESQTEKIPIYDTLALAQADLSNLEENQIIATKFDDTGLNLAPVDAVTNGVMNPVTSNAVADYTNNKLFKIYDNIEATNIENYLATLNCKEPFNVRFTNNGTTGDLVDLTGQYLFNIVNIPSRGDNTLQIAISSVNNVTAVRSWQWWNDAWSTWVQLTDSRVDNIPVTIDTSHITNYGNDAWVNCFKNGKVVTVTVEVSNGSANFTADSINRIAFGFPIPANSIVNGTIVIDNKDIYKKVWIDHGVLYAWVGDNYTGNLFATITYIEA